MSAPVISKTSGIEEAIARVMSPAVNPVNESFRKGIVDSTESMQQDYRWRGLDRNMDLLQLREFYATGWPEGAERLRTAMEKVAASVARSVRRRGRWADQGDELSRDRLYAGQWETAWRTTSRVVVAAPTRIRIVADVCSGAIVKADALFWRGAAAASLAETLVAAGYAVQVVSAAATYSPDESRRPYVATCVVKDWTAPLNITTLAAAVCSASFFRTVMFGLWIQSGKKKMSNGLGEARPIGTYPETFADPAVKTVVVSQDCLSAGAANTWVADQVRALEAGAVA